MTLFFFQKKMPTMQNLTCINHRQPRDAFDPADWKLSNQLLLAPQQICYLFTTIPIYPLEGGGKEETGVPLGYKILNRSMYHYVFCPKRFWLSHLLNDDRVHAMLIYKDS